MSLEGIRALPVENKPRQAAMDVLNKAFPDKGIANMISNNLVYTEESDYNNVEWCINLDSILDNLDSLVGFPKNLNSYEGPTFFINGGLSIEYEEGIYKEKFPNAVLHEVEGAGHYVHQDKQITTA